MSKPTYTIGVTGLNAIDSPGSGIAVIKALKEAKSFNVRIIGFAYESMEPGVYMHEYVDKSYQVPYPSAGQEVLFERIKYINSIENLDVIIPNFDAELYNYICLQNQLENELKIKMVLPSKEQFEARHKTNLSAYGKKYGIKVPEAKETYSMAEATAIGATTGYPIVVKGKFYDASVAYTADQAMQQFSKISAEWGLPILVQQFISGTEVNLCGIGDGTGKTLGAVPMKKIYITDKGKAWSGVTTDDKKLLEVCHQLVKATKWEGPFELEFMKTDDDEYYLIEINPRFPAWCYLAVGAGQNQVESMVNLAMGKTVKPFKKYDIGKMFVRYSNDMIVDLKEFETISTTGEL
jgi:carbamoyl-phosphate synthase large subunit